MDGCVPPERNTNTPSASDVTSAASPQLRILLGMLQPLIHLMCAECEIIYWSFLCRCVRIEGDFVSKAGSR